MDKTVRTASWASLAQRVLRGRQEPPAELEAQAQPEPLDRLAAPGPRVQRGLLASREQPGPLVQQDQQGLRVPMVFKVRTDKMALTGRMVFVVLRGRQAPRVALEPLVQQDQPEAREPLDRQAPQEAPEQREPLAAQGRLDLPAAWAFRGLTAKKDLMGKMVPSDLPGRVEQQSRGLQDRLAQPGRPSLVPPALRGPLVRPEEQGRQALLVSQGRRVSMDLTEMMAMTRPLVIHREVFSRSLH